MNATEKLAVILGVKTEVLSNFVKLARSSTGQDNVLERIDKENNEIVLRTLEKIEATSQNTSNEIRGALRKVIFYQEKKFLNYLNTLAGKDEFERAANLSQMLNTANDSYFLKKEVIAEIFKAHRPSNLLDYLGYNTVDELLKKEKDLLIAFSALRFVESDEWMHQTFDLAYNNFTSHDFEKRDIEVKVLGPKWYDIAKRFVEKKHHNVSHLKEFGVIFLNPIKMDIPGKFLRDFALLLHYFHEISFYSKLFKKYSQTPHFTENFKALLRGDVKKLNDISENQWLIVQRYLIKENPQDARLFQPRVNPESLHWARGERDLGKINHLSNGQVDLSLWYNLDWVGELFTAKSGQAEVVSFDLEDNAMSLVSFMDGKNEVFTYHQREALWNKIFMEYLGGEEKLEEALIENFDKGTIKLT